MPSPGAGWRIVAGVPRAFAAGDDELVEAERLIRTELGALDLDMVALAAVSNVFRAATAVRNHMERGVLRQHRLSWSAFVVLFVLRIWGEQESGHLAAEAGITGGTLTGVLNTLERKGYTERAPHPTDGRRMIVRATPPGHRVVDEIMPAFNKQEALVTRDLTDAEATDLAAYLRTLLRTVADLDTS